MHVLLVEPAFPSNQREFARALSKVGARVTGIGEAPLDALDDQLKSWLHGYEQVGSVVNEAALLHAVRRCQKRERVDRLEATVEAHIMPTAHVREKCGIPGTSVRTSFLCRDKPAMKQALREAGVPCAQSDGVSSTDELKAFARNVGLPIIVKPRDAAGAQATYRVDETKDLDRVASEMGLDHGASAAAEEFIEGHEAFYDTITRDGEVVHEFITHYYPTVLEGMRKRWISPQFIATNRMNADAYEEVRRLGKQVIDALGIGTSATHMEWFFGPKGLKFSEIGCRPPGVGAWDVYCAANEMDLYAEWARAITGQSPAERPSRKFAAGMIALRPNRDGRIAGYEGLDRLERDFGRWIVDRRFPAPGSPTGPVEAGFMANAWMRMRHPDYDELRRMLNWVGENVRVFAE